jgi:hypothetical protein
VPLRHDYASDINALASAVGEQLKQQRLEKQQAEIEQSEAKELEPIQSEASASAADSSVLPDLSAASGYLSNARRDIQRNVRTPISTDDTLELMTLLTSIYDLLTLEIINVRLQQQQHRSVTQPGLADDGSAILDKANEYLTLARHFFDRRVEEARIGRQSDTAKVEVAAVAGEAASLKGSIIEYLQSVENALRMIDLRK